MPDLKLDAAQAILTATLESARDKNLKPLAVVVYDARGALKALVAEDGTSLKRAEIAMGKAQGALAFGLGSRALSTRAAENPSFMAAVTHAVGGMLVAAPGGVLIRDRGGDLVGAVGVSGDTSDNDEVVAVAGIAAAGLVPETG